MEPSGIDMGIVRGLIVVVSLATFLGICWWAYRPASRGRFENDGWLVFDPEEIAMRGGEPVPVRAETRKEVER